METQPMPGPDGAPTSSRRQAHASDRSVAYRDKDEPATDEGPTHPGPGSATHEPRITTSRIEAQLSNRVALEDSDDAKEKHFDNKEQHDGEEAEQLPLSDS